MDAELEALKQIEKATKQAREAVKRADKLQKRQAAALNKYNAGHQTRRGFLAFLNRGRQNMKDMGE
jgi:hypothetical protein